MGITEYFNRQRDKGRFRWRKLRIRKEVSQTVVHTVRPGETLCAIALRYYKDASRWEDIFLANQPALRQPDMIHSGLELIVPGVS